MKFILTSFEIKSYIHHCYRSTKPRRLQTRRIKRQTLQTLKTVGDISISNKHRCFNIDIQYFSKRGSAFHVANNSPIFVSKYLNHQVRFGSRASNNRRCGNPLRSAATSNPIQTIRRTWTIPFTARHTMSIADDAAMMTSSPRYCRYAPSQRGYHRQFFVSI